MQLKACICEPRNPYYDQDAENCVICWLEKLIIVVFADILFKYLKIHQETHHVENDHNEREYYSHPRIPGEKPVIIIFFF